MSLRRNRMKRHNRYAFIEMYFSGYESEDEKIKRFREQFNINGEPDELNDLPSFTMFFGTCAVIGITIGLLTRAYVM